MGSDIERRELERTAFGKPATAEDAEAAQAALRRLVADDGAAAHVAAEARTVDPAEIAEPVEHAEPAAPIDDDSPQPRTLARRLPLVALGAFLVVFAVGFGLGRVVPGTAAHPPDPTASLFARFAPSTTFQGQANASSQSALATLALPQTPEDKGTSADLTRTLGIESGSLHRIMQVQGGLTLWAGRTTSAICLIFTGGSTASAGASCATPKQFDQGGLEIHENSYTWTWDGTTFATTFTG